MKKQLVCITALFVAATSLSMYRAPYRDLLSEEDYRREEEGSKTPAVTAPSRDGIVDWKSFDQWQCFSTDQLKTECDPDEDGQDICYPHLIVEQGADVFDFQLLTPGDYLNSNWILSRWHSLLTDEDSFCVYSAYLPDISSPHESVFSIDQLKTVKGYWEYGSEENWREPDDDVDVSPTSG
jgi:hypothetical protein